MTERREEHTGVGLDDVLQLRGDLLGIDVVQNEGRQLVEH